MTIEELYNLKLGDKVILNEDIFVFIRIDNYHFIFEDVNYNYTEKRCYVHSELWYIKYEPDEDCYELPNELSKFIIYSKENHLTLIEKQIEDHFKIIEFLKKKYEELKND